MAALYDRYSSLVYAVALRVLGDTGAAEDVLQEVFLQLWRNPAAFDSSRGNLGAWLGVITRNRAIDGLRKRRPETDVEEIEPEVTGRYRVGDIRKQKRPDHIGDLAEECEIDRPRVSAGADGDHLRAHAPRHRLDLIVIDHLGLWVDAIGRKLI